MEVSTELSGKQFSESDQKEWNEFISASPYGDILHFWQWGEVKLGEGWEPFRLGIRRNGKLILAAQCLLKKAPLLGSVLYVPYGPVFNSEAELAAGIHTLKHLLLNLAKEHNCFAIELEPKLGTAVDDLAHFKNLQHFTDHKLLHLFENEGFSLSGRNMQPKFKLFYDLELSEDELLSLMKKNTRYNVRLAAKKGVKINSYLPDDPQTDNKVEEFYQLLKQTQERAKGYPIRPLGSFQKLFSEFKGTNNLVLYEAVYEGQVIAMNITERTGYWSSSFYAASNRLFPEVKAPYLLRWESVKDAKAFGCKIYDFWGIIPGSEQHHGYSDTKISFGGARIDYYGILALPLNRSKYFFWNRMLPLRAKLSEKLRK
jgi:lipid II:glycine glycyltransferase (peptidoglycan interpeptide bridge formation enzyme)